jgi:hypothetical protein
MATTPQLQVRLRQPRFAGESRPVTQSAVPRLGLVIGAGQHMAMANGDRRYDLCVLDLDAPGTSLTLIPMGFFGHGFAPHPRHPERLAVFEKRGRGACEIDLKSGAVTRPIETAASREFYGHGAYSPDGTLLYATETVVEGDYEGVIVVRDAESHEILGELPSFGSSPHDCQLVDGGRVMVVANGGGPRNGVPPSVTYVDVREERLLERLELENPDINAGHLDSTPEGGLAVVSAQREGLPDRDPGGISLRLADGSFRTLTEPRKLVERLFGETLSVCIHEPTGIVGATTPAGNLLTFWELATGALRRYYILQNPRGIELSQDGEHFLVSFGFGNPPEALCVLSARTLEKVDGYDLAPTGITGSHLMSYNLPAELRA